MFDATHAEAIAAKLGARVERQRRSHSIVKVTYGNVYVAQYGIRRDTSTGHDYIPAQLQVTPHQCAQLAQCTMSAAQYWDILRSKGVLPPSQPAAAPPTITRQVVRRHHKKR